MGINYSKLPTNQQIHAGDEVKERIQDLEKHIFNLQIRNEVLLKKYIAVTEKQAVEPEKRNREEAEESQIQDLTRQLNDANGKIKRLRESYKSLRTEKYRVELSKTELQEQFQEIEKKKNELELELKIAHKKYLRRLLEKGELCAQDCVLCSLLWICNEKLNVYPCGRHLEKILTIHAERKTKLTPDQLRCDELMDILMTGEIVKVILNTKYHTSVKDDEKSDKIAEAWQKLMTTDKKCLVVMVGFQFSAVNRAGHCVVCDLETREAGWVKYYDMQKEEWGEANEEIFRYRVVNHEGIKLYTVNFGELKKIIEENRHILHTTNLNNSDCLAENGASGGKNKNGNRIVELVDTDCTAERDTNMLPGTSANESEHIVYKTDHAFDDADRAPRDADRGASDADRASSGPESDTWDADCGASDADRSSSVPERAACNAERAACDAERDTCGVERAVSGVELVVGTETPTLED